MKLVLKSVLVCTVVLGAIFAKAQQGNDSFLYKNSKLNSEIRAKDLLSRMTDEEKVAQLMGVWNTNFSYADNKLDSGVLKSLFSNGVHSLHPSFSNIKQTVELRNAVQKYLREKTKWGIPALFVDEGQHGLMRPEATVFPQAIGLACSWNTNLIEKVYDVAAREMRARGTQFVLSPVVDVCRDPRWGRIEETYGEDPYLNAQIGIAAIKGLQGSLNGTIDANHVAATLKHFVGHAQPDGGINQAPANYSLRDLYTYHMYPFQQIIKYSKPLAVMPSYNEVDGVPSHANKWLLKDALRKQFGFDGMIVSDYSGINQLHNKHFVAATEKDAAALAFNAGVQAEFPKPAFYKKLPQLLEENKIDRTEFDAAVYQVLKLKFDLGLFDNSNIDYTNAVAVSKLESSKQLALQAAQQSIVLLKNDGVLPLKKWNKKTIAVIGPGANTTLYGGYAGEPYSKTTLLQAIGNKVGKENVLFAQGCKLTDNASDTAQFNWKMNEIKITPHKTNEKLIAEAIAIAKKSDLIILAIGENEQLCREAWSEKHLGDNLSLDLFGDQQELADSLLTLNKPLIVYLQNGRPLSINKLQAKANAIVEAWYMGQEGCIAGADVLFGDVNPSGKLTVTFPKNVGQLPMYYNHKPSAQFHNYISEDNKPLYPFGFGLSYTTYSYSNIKLSSANMNANDTVWASVQVTNTGKMNGDEIVQLYIHDKVSSVTRPVKELKGFERITLNVGETKTVQFAIEASKLAFWDINMNYKVEPDDFEIMIGSSSEKVLSALLKVN